MPLDGCDAETYRDVYWPETNLGVTANVPCPCAEFAGSLAGRVVRYCGGTYSQGARWEASADISDYSALNSETTRRLCQAARVKKDILIWKDILILLIIEQSQNASVASEVAVEVTAKPEQLTSADVSTSISIVVDLLAEEALNNSKVHNILVSYS